MQDKTEIHDVSGERSDYVVAGLDFYAELERGSCALWEFGEKLVVAKYVY